MSTERVWTRRRFISGAAAAGGGILLVGLGGSRLPLALGQAASQPAPDVTPGEDLMREHGVLRRAMLIYEKCIRRLEANQELPPAAVNDPAEIIRIFIEGYHEKLEEDYLFPRFEKAGVLADLAKTLRAQHEAGRTLTAEILRLSAGQPHKTAQGRAELAKNLRAFVVMYAPHAAREDTVLFPAIHRVFSPKEYDKLGDDFEDKEHDLFGEDGFEKMVDKVAVIEKSLGIYDLAQFTPGAAK